MINQFRFSLCGAMLLLPMAGHAGSTYVGVEGAYADRPQYKNVDHTYGEKLLFGYAFDDTPVMLEASYIHTGAAQVDHDHNQTLKFDGFTLGAGYYWKVSPQGSKVWLRGAYYHGRSTVEYYSDEQGINANGAALGLGVLWKLNDWFGLRAEYETLLSVSDGNVSEDDHSKPSLDLISAGIVIEFGGSGSGSAAAVRNGPVLSAPATAAPAAPALPASPPVATTADGPRLLSDTPLRTQPRSDSPTQKMMAAGTPVQPRNPVTNADGSWVYIDDGNGSSGWIAARALAR